jgi:hypothetical protein
MVYNAANSISQNYIKKLAGINSVLAISWGIKYKVLSLRYWEKYYVQGIKY